MDNFAATVNNYRFSFYSPEEVRAISVLEVSKESTFDGLTGRVIDHGLHDLAMGPTTEKDVCLHCGFDYLQCPGHMGHIEFSKPVYNPMLFDLVFRVCFRFENHYEFS